MPNTKIVTCETCGKQVEVKLIPYGNGNIATCPIYKQLAYNGGK
jgi:hypothetical protein